MRFKRDAIIACCFIVVVIGVPYVLKRQELDMMVIVAALAVMLISLILILGVLIG